MLLWCLGGLLNQNESFLLRKNVSDQYQPVVKYWYWPLLVVLFLFLLMCVASACC